MISLAEMLNVEKCNLVVSLCVTLDKFDPFFSNRPVIFVFISLMAHKQITITTFHFEKCRLVGCNGYSLTTLLGR